MPREAYLTPSFGPVSTLRGGAGLGPYQLPWEGKSQAHQPPLVLVAPAENAADESDDDCYDEVHWTWCPPFCFLLGVTTPR